MQKFLLRANPNFFKESVNIRNHAFSLYIRSNSSDLNRYAVIIPKKSLPLATKRNSLKRKILSQLQLLEPSLQNRDVVLRVINPRGLDENVKIAYELKSIINKANLGL